MATHLPFHDLGHTIHCTRISGSLQLWWIDSRFRSHHSLHQKLGVVRTLVDRCDKIVSEDQDKLQEESNIKSVLSHCGIKITISGICQWISINEVSKWAEINSSSFDNLHFPPNDVNIEIWVLEATFRKHLLSSLLCRIVYIYIYIYIYLSWLAEEQFSPWKKHQENNANAYKKWDSKEMKIVGEWWRYFSLNVVS